MPPFKAFKLDKYVIDRHLLTTIYKRRKIALKIDFTEIDEETPKITSKNNENDTNWKHDNVAVKSCGWSIYVGLPPRVCATPALGEVGSFDRVGLRFDKCCCPE